jgi:hypothetical protein
MILAWLNYRGVFMTLTVNFWITFIAFLSIIVLFIGRRTVDPGKILLHKDLSDRSALWLDRVSCRAAFRHLVLSGHRRHVPGGGRGALARPRPAARHHHRDHHAADRCGPHLVRRVGLLPWEYVGWDLTRAAL